MGESIDYLRHVVDVSPTALLRFASIMPFANSRKVLPEDAWFVAQVVASQNEDCGTCLQITVNLAQQGGVDRALLRAAVDGDCGGMSQEMADVYRFTKLVLAAAGGEDDLRETLRERYGDRGLIELSYAIAASRIPPTVKRALGFAKSCSLAPVKL